MSDHEHETAASIHSDRTQLEAFADPNQRYIPSAALPVPQTVADREKSDIEKFVDQKIEQLRVMSGNVLPPKDVKALDTMRVWMMNNKMDVMEFVEKYKLNDPDFEGDGGSGTGYCRSASINLKVSGEPKMSVKGIRGDGHCFFRSLTSWLTGEETNWEAVRLAIISYGMIENIELEIQGAKVTYSDYRLADYNSICKESIFIERYGDKPPYSDFIDRKSVV